MLDTLFDKVIQYYLMHMLDGNTIILIRLLEYLVIVLLFCYFLYSFFLYCSRKVSQSIAYTYITQFVIRYH